MNFYRVTKVKVTIKIILLLFLIYMPLTQLVLAQDKVLTFAIFPYVGPSKIIKHHGNLKAHLEDVLKKKISIVSAPNFKTFIKRTRNQQYDIVLTAPHHARYAELNEKYQIIAVTQHRIQGYVLVKKTSYYNSLNDLKGKIIASVPPLAMLTQILKEQLELIGLSSEEIKFSYTSTHSNAIFSVLKNQSDAALTGIMLFNRLTKKDKDQLRVLDKTEKIPGFVVMVKDSLDAQQIDEIKLALFTFSSTDLGNKFVFKGFKEINNTQLKLLDKYIKPFNHIN